jgi:hypothetical protein
VNPDSSSQGVGKKAHPVIADAGNLSALSIAASADVFGCTAGKDLKSTVLIVETET